MTTYIFRRPHFCKADVDEFITTDRAAFEDFIMSRTDNYVVREVQKFGIEFRLAMDGDRLAELMDRICDGYFENMAEGDLFGEGMDALGEDFLELGRDPEDDFCGITIRGD